jgi:hypothetical protein
MAESTTAEELLEGLTSLLEQKKEEAEAEEEWYVELTEELEEIKRKIDGNSRSLDRFATSLDYYTRSLTTFSQKIDVILDPPRAECDNCGIAVNMVGHHEPNYIQNLGWTVEDRGKKLYCPLCTRVRSGE